MELYFYIKNNLTKRFYNVKKVFIENRIYTAAELTAIAPSEEWEYVILAMYGTPIISLPKSLYPAKMTMVLPV